MTEMSEIRRPAPSMLDHVGVRGMLDNDIPGIDESRLRETTRGAGPIVTCADSSSGQVEPDTSDRREATATCNERVIIRPEEPGRDNGLDEAVTAELVGQMAIDSRAKSRGFPNINIV